MRIRALVLLFPAIVSTFDCTPRAAAPFIDAGEVLISEECQLLTESGADPWIELLCPLAGGGATRVRLSRVAWGAARASLDAGPGK